MYNYNILVSYLFYLSNTYAGMQQRNVLNPKRAAEQIARCDFAPVQQNRFERDSEERGVMGTRDGEMARAGVAARVSLHQKAIR